MNPQDIRTLKLLEALDNPEAPSQRDLATSLGISLGLVNAFIKRLARKGYFKITHLPRNRIAYILTPSGAAEKTRLTYEYIRYSLQYYKVTRERLAGVYRRFQNEGAQRVVFFGLSELTEIAYVLIQHSSMEIVAVVDPEHEGDSFFDLTVQGLKALTGLAFDRLMITTLPGGASPTAMLIAAGVKPQSITWIH